MKSTENFKKVIENHLQEVANTDTLFAETLKKENKNIDDCVTYILNEVQKSGCNGFADEEIFGMAVHYYDEDDIKPGIAISAKVVVNHSIDISEEEIAAAKQKALDDIIAKETEKILAKPVKKKIVLEVEQSSLFD